MLRSRYIEIMQYFMIAKITKVSNNVVHYNCNDFMCAWIYQFTSGTRIVTILMHTYYRYIKTRCLRDLITFLQLNSTIRTKAYQVTIKFQKQ